MTTNTPLPQPARLSEPSHQEITALVALFNEGRYPEAATLAQALTERFPLNGFCWKALGALLKQMGRTGDALLPMQKAAALSPNDPESHHNLGNALRELGRLDEAEASCRRALLINPGYAEAHCNLGAIQQKLLRPGEAEASFRRAIQIEPQHAEAHYNLGNTLRELGRPGEAEASYRQALQTKPRFADAHVNLGIALQELERPDEAEASYRQALQLAPHSAHAHCNLGIALDKLGRPDEAEASCRRALQIDPDYADAHLHLGNILQKLERPHETEASYRRALQLKPDFAEAHCNLGSALQDSWQFAEAEASCRRALQLKPDFAEAHCNLGIALHELGRLAEAEASYRRVLQLKPDFTEAHCNLGNTLKDLGRLDEAVASYRRALEIKPDFTEAHSNLLFSNNYLSDQPAAMLQAEARRFGALAAQKANPAQTWPNLPEPGRCLRVGLVSGDFCSHPVGFFVESALAALASHACGRLEFTGYHSYFLTDALTERIKACCRGWHSTMGLSDTRLAQLIRDDGIDILIDLSGHTAHNRLPMFAWKPAPVQASWLGYFATTGVAAMDYLIADPWTLPETEEVNFTEAIWRLPETRLCFTPPDTEVKVSPLPALTNGHVTFGCFNSLSKMNDAVVALWARVLHAVPQSRLFLKAKQLGEASVRQSVRQRFAAQGIGADRLTLESSSPRPDYLAAYGRVDIALDPFPYPGGATTAEALWMGVPVLTLAGERFLARQGVGLLANAGLPDWIAADADDYAARAVAHAGDLPRLAALRAGLRQQVLGSPIFDAPRFARHFEAALRGMWATWCNRCDPQLNQQQRTEATEASENALEEPATNEPSPEDIDTLTTLFNEGRTPEAATMAQALTERFPLHGFGWNALGALLKQMGRTGDALLSMQKAAALSPNDAAAHYNLGGTLHELGRPEEAETSYRKTLQIAPDFAEAHYNLGNILHELGRPDEAETSYRQALLIAPDHVHAHYNLGNILHELGRPGEAEASYRQALQIKPDYAEAHCNRGNTLHELGRLDEAEASCRRALQINPDFAETHNNLGRVLQDRGRLVDAKASYRQALESKPDFAEAHNNLGNILSEFGQLGDALASYRLALKIKSDFAEAHSNLLFAHNYLADQPAAMLLTEARRFGDLAAQKACPTQPWLNVPDPGKCLRVGLVSGDLGEHPVGYFLDSNLAALMSHTAGRLELIAYHNHFRTDALTERIKACCCAWHSAVGLSDAQLAQRIRDDGIDILIDLSGHTRHNRLPMFAWKPAPVQASWLGYFATTGVAAIDYLIADPWTLPETEEVNFTEAIWRLPETRLCFTPPDAEVAVSPLPALTNTNGRITFGCFNNLSKMNDAVVALWARVLHAAPQSCLFLKAKQLGEVSVRQSVLERFAAGGIGADRLLLEGSSPRRDYLAAYGRVDIALDPFPYTGGATTAEALWMGVPVLTLAGERFLARQGVGLLANAGLPDWIAADADDYVARAVSHAGDLPRLATLRAGLRQQVLVSPIFDAPRFARHFEAALRDMWTTWCNRCNPQQSRPQRQQQHRQQRAEAAAPRTLPGNPAPVEPLTAAEMNRLAALSDAGRHAETESGARSLIAQHPDSGFAWKALGIALAMQGKPALPAWQKATALLPDDAIAHYNLGVILQDLGQLDGAAASYRRTVEINADFADAYCNLGNVLKGLGRLDDAVASYRRAVEINPDFAEAHCSLGNALKDLGHPADAAAACRRALLIDPDFAEAHCNLGNALQSLGQLDDAAAACRRALLINPNFAEAHYNLGVILHELGRSGEAETSYRQALQLNPDYAEAHCNLGLVCHELGRLDEAEARYRQALRIKPDFATMHQNLAATLLAQGKLADGWEEYEWRWETDQLSEARRHFAQPQWRGEAAEGKTLLIHAEQGYGDTLQFCRYAQLAAARGLRVIVEAPAALVRLLQSLPGAGLVIAAGTELPPFDLHCPMLSMPLALNTTLATIPSSAPYLHADPAQADAWRARLAALPNRGFRIGLAWAGCSRAHCPRVAAVDRRRSIAPERLAP
ncbi:MAG: tetratricopeptide repeat protein, partial [Nevskiales bacterium]